MLTYHVIRRKNIKTGDILYYPQLVTAAADDRAKIIERIEKKCTLASADVKAVVDALEVEIIDCLQQGRSIRLGDLGSFRPSLRCGKGVKEEQSVSPAMIKRVHIVFHPSSRIRRALSVKDHAVSFYRRDKKKKGDGTNQPGTTPPGTNPAGTGGTPSGTGVIPRARPRRAAPLYPRVAQLFPLPSARAAILRARPLRAAPPYPRVAQLFPLPSARAARAAILRSRVVTPRVRPRRAALPLPRAARLLPLRAECPRWRPPVTKPSAVATRSFAGSAGAIGGRSSPRWGSATPWPPIA